MRFRKTPLNQRGTYTYHFAAGESVTLTPGKNGVTELDIKALHSAGDSEVYFNIKNTRPKLTEEEKAAIKDWEDKHPGEEAPKNWNLSIESLQDDGVDLDKAVFSLMHPILRLKTYHLKWNVYVKWWRC